MSFQRLAIFMLGFAIIAIPAKASIYYGANTQLAFTTRAQTTDGLTVSSLETFTGSLTTDGILANDEYLDPISGIEFLAFSQNGSTQQAFTSVAGGVLNMATSGGNSIEVIFPTGIDVGFAFNFTTPSSSGDNLCVDTSVGNFGNCDDNLFISQNGSGFIGALDDVGSLTTLSTLWLHVNGLATSTDLQSFEVATQGSSAPEPATMLLIGMGLIAIRGIDVIRKRRAARH
jgi:hypothetical protein